MTFLLAGARSHSLPALLFIPPHVLIRTRALSTAADRSSVATDSTPSRSSAVPPPWRSSSILDDWVQREARPISLRQLTVFGRTLTESRLIESANYVRLELPTRIAHRLRNMQTLPYSALTNKHITDVYEMYYSAFERLRKVTEVRSLADNDAFCDLINTSLREHLSVIPNLAMGVIQIQDSVSAEQCDRLMTTLLRSRISRRVIAEQHLALTDTFASPWHFPNAPNHHAVDPADDFVGEIFLKCNAAEIISRCATATRDLCAASYGSSVRIPDVNLHGHLETAFPYIPSHLEYIIGELLRNSIQAAVGRHRSSPDSSPPPPIDVLICEAAQHVIIRVSDRGGGVPAELLPYLWSFAKGPRRDMRLRNLASIPQLAGTMHEVGPPAATEAEQRARASTRREATGEGERFGGSLEQLSARLPDLKLGMGLPMSRIYAEYWAGSLEVHSLEGYGTDAFLQVSRLGNKNETLSTRATMDAL